MDEFKKWLEGEMQQRKWGISDLAKAAHVSRGAIGNLLRGERNPGANICEGIARALRIPPDVVFRHAGLLPPIYGHDELIQEIDHIANQLTEQRRGELAAYARLQLQLQEERGEYRVTGAETSKP